MCRMRKENVAQCECLKRLKGEVLELIDKYAVELRDIICEHEEKTGEVPTGDELVWILCEHHGQDLTKTKE